jgi:4-hydroxyphenylpyruvate dioxygenase
LPSPMNFQTSRAWPSLQAFSAYGDTIHTFVERGDYPGAFLPGFRAIDNDPVARPTGLLHIDHMVGNVGWNEMNAWVDFYANVMGFSLYQHFDDKDISTTYSALMSKVMANGNGYVKFPINEPAEGKKEIADRRVSGLLLRPRRAAHRSGQQRHSAHGKQAARTRHRVPARSAHLLHRTAGPGGQIDEPVDELEKLGILVDRDDEGYMLQIFTRPVEDRPTLFFEIIQRKGSRSFGKGNFKALFEAIEREQQARGNL